MKKRIIIFSLIAIIIIGVVSIDVAIYNSNSSYIRVTYNPTYIYIEAKYLSSKLEYNAIKDVSIKETEYGNIRLDGFSFNNCEVGVFKNENMGSYISYVSKKSKISVVVNVKPEFYASSYFVIALSSVEENNNLFEYLNNKIT